MPRYLFTIFVAGVLANAPSIAGQHVRVAVFDNPPLMTYDAVSRRAGGIFIDILDHAAQREDWELEYVPGNPGQSFERLENGTVDLLAAVPHTRAREEKMAFSRETVAMSWGRIYVRPGSSIQTLRDLSGKPVAILKGTQLQRPLLHGLADAGSPPRLMEFDDFGQAFRAVADGRAEAVLTNRFTGSIYAGQTGLHATAVVLSPYGFRFATARRPEMERLLDALDRDLLLLKTDPRSFYYADLEALEATAREYSVPAWVYWGTAAGVGGLLLALAWAAASRRHAARIARSEADTRTAHDRLRAAHAELRRAHEALSRIAAHSPDAIAVFDANFIVQRVNPAAENLLGAARDELVGRSALKWVPPERRATSRRILEQVRGGACLQGHASQVLRSDGVVIPVLWSLAWSDEVQELYAIGHDDTERNELIVSLHRQTEQLQSTNRDLQTFAQTVSHDLRAPVAAVTGFVGKVLRDEAGAMQQRSHALLTRALAAGERMDEIIANLLRLARVTEGGVRRRRCDITAMCEDVVAALRGENPERCVTVNVQPGMTALADGELLHHVLNNLLSNAWKFTARRAVANIRVECKDGHQGRTFAVHDDGAGFDMDHANSLFKPFGRLHSDQQFMGTGIGLCVAHRVVTAHGGRIWAEGNPGAGAAFFFSLGEPTDVRESTTASPPDGRIASSADNMAA